MTTSKHPTLLSVGSRVSKPRGYLFDGIVVALFTTSTGEQRLVVEKVEEGAPTGLLHIFAPSQVIAL